MRNLLSAFLGLEVDGSRISDREIVIGAWMARKAWINLKDGTIHDLFADPVNIAAS